MEPLRYNHIWEGGLDELSEARKVLPMYLLRQCVAAWDRRPVRGAFGTGGFDVADTGADANALALRVGPELYPHREVARFGRMDGIRQRPVCRRSNGCPRHNSIGLRRWRR